ncbi:hypothetical protein W97_00299 [Coniosporium apollinis CBS 100218]|uniref:SNF7 family protein n=1 Tax=Coniosporium apollinis (strain CBS 100218) TaxID=1168221 RepID=R7YGU4_CONA1|nr:uncharacterized protein W97_00299 [Coniosporium apollinis CBS 100218]EON61088.1 hypothetical protein W97_00299 [Coniosporium apollinis CBS 100218]
MSELLNFILDHEEAFRRARLASLYSDFRYQQATNPDGYVANINAWRKALIDASRAGLLPGQGASNDLLSIRTGEELARALETKQWGRPLALGAVIHDAVSKKEMIPLKEFLASKTSIYARSWTLSPWAVLSWSLRQVGLLSSNPASDTLAVGSFVIVANIEAAAAAVLAQIRQTHTSNIALIHSRETFTTAFAHALSPSLPLSATDITILLTHLSRDKSACALSTDGRTIKLAAPGTEPTPVTEQDVTIAHLRTLVTSLEAQIPALAARVSELDASARKDVAAKSKTAAMSALRSKKLATSALERRTATLSQLEEVMAGIEQAADQVEVVRIMAASAGVLKGLNKEVGGAEGVEGVVEALREEMVKVDEVSGVLNEVGAEGAVDEEEVDEEFEALERDAREKREAAEAEETRRRLEELERIETEKKAKEQEADRRRTEDGQRDLMMQELDHVMRERQPEDTEVEETLEGFGRMSLDEVRPAHAEAEKRDKDAVPAS